MILFIKCSFGNLAAVEHLYGPDFLNVTTHLSINSLCLLSFIWSTMKLGFYQNTRPRRTVWPPLKTAVHNERNSPNKCATKRSLRKPAISQPWHEQWMLAGHYQRVTVRRRSTFRLPTALFRTEIKRKSERGREREKERKKRLHGNCLTRETRDYWPWMNFPEVLELVKETRI